MISLWYPRICMRTILNGGAGCSIWNEEHYWAEGLYRSDEEGLLRDDSVMCETVLY